MTATPAEVPDAVYAEAAKHFSEAQLVELAATAAMENYRARLNRAFLVEAQGFYRPAALDTRPSGAARDAGEFLDRPTPPSSRAGA